MLRTVAVVGAALLLWVVGLAPAGAAGGRESRDDPALELARHGAGAQAFGGLLGVDAMLEPASQHCEPWEAVSEDVRLTEDIEDCLIRVVADDVTIDLAGFTGGLVLALADRLTIRDGTIRGAFLAFTADARLQRVTVRDSPAAFAVEAGLRTVVEHSRFTGNTVGISFYFDDGGSVTGSEFDGNAIGLVIGGHDGVTVRGNHFGDNAVGLQVWDEDLHGASHNLVERNRFSGNVVGAQLLAARQADGNHFVNNHFKDNAASGMYVRATCSEFFEPGCGGDGTVVDRTSLLGNGHDPVQRTWFDEETETFHTDTLDDGLLVTGMPRAVGGVTVQGNVALHNADHGIEAAGVVDGGRNVAVGNGNPAQCAGVTCRPGR